MKQNLFTRALTTVLCLLILFSTAAFNSPSSLQPFGLKNEIRAGAPAEVQSRPNAILIVPDPFGKSSPADSSTNQLVTVTLSWAASANATGYEYCIDTNPTPGCDTSWTPVAGTSVMPGLAWMTVYYWQVRAPGGATVEADGGTWWMFATGPNPPGEFAKTSPSTAAVNLPLSFSIYWNMSSNAASYEYCYYSTNSADCNEPWTLSTAGNNAALSGLAYSTTYHWQVRARNTSGVTPANYGVWWTFTTVPPAPSGFGKSAPANAAVNVSLSPTLTWSASTGAASYEYCYYSTNAADCNEPWVNSTTGTSASLSGLAYGTTYHWMVRARNVTDTTPADSNTWWTFTTLYQTVKLNLLSNASQDGWVLESGETSTVGGTVNGASTTMNLGDDAARRQYRSILSFATGSALPDNAVITKVMLKVRRQSIVGGGNPVTIFQGFMVDLKNGMFGTSVLQASDFQTTGGQTYGPFNLTPTNSWYTINLSSGKAYINKFSTNSGLTQIRLRFKLDDNNNTIANYLVLYSGNSTSANRPQLIVEYYEP